MYTYNKSCSGMWKACIATEEAEGSAVYDYIHDGVNGFVVPINDLSMLVEKMELIFRDEK